VGTGATPINPKLVESPIERYTLNGHIPAGGCHRSSTPGIAPGMIEAVSLVGGAGSG
jgi:hypothetical protein